jgi:hypothetical protein
MPIARTCFTRSIKLSIAAGFVASGIWRSHTSRVFSVTAARHCPTAAGAVLGGIRWLPLNGVLALSAYATKMGRSLVPAFVGERDVAGLGPMV